MNRQILTDLLGRDFKAIKYSGVMYTVVHAALTFRVGRQRDDYSVLPD